jgi:hypothetical protein
MSSGSRVTRRSKAERLDTTMGAALLMTKRCCLVRVQMSAQDRRGAHGLLYLAAGQRRQARAGTSLDPHLICTRPAPGLHMP